LLKETTGAFDGVSNPQPPHYESDVQPIAPRRPLEERFHKQSRVEHANK